MWVLLLIEELNCLVVQPIHFLKQVPDGRMLRMYIQQ